MKVPPAPTDPAPPRLWLVFHGDIAAIDRVSLDGRSLIGIMIVQRSDQGDLLARMDANSARYEKGHWTLYGVRVARQNHAQATMLPTADWPQGPLPANMIDLARPVGSMTVERLIATIRHRWAGSQSMAFYRTQLHGMIASLFDPLLMVLLAAPALLAPPRASGGGIYTATSPHSGAWLPHIRRSSQCFGRVRHRAALGRRMGRARVFRELWRAASDPGRGRVVTPPFGCSPALCLTADLLSLNHCLEESECIRAGIDMDRACPPPVEAKRLAALPDWVQVRERRSVPGPA